VKSVVIYFHSPRGDVLQERWLGAGAPERSTKNSFDLTNVNSLPGCQRYEQDETLDCNVQVSVHETIAVERLEKTAYSLSSELLSGAVYTPGNSKQSNRSGNA